MKRTVLKILLGILAAGAAGGGGYLLWQHHNKKKAEQRDNEPLEVEHISYQPKKSEKPSVVIRDDDDMAKGETDMPKEKFASRVSSYEQTNGEKENFEAYISSMESPEDDEPDEDEDYDESDLDIPGHNSDDGPYQITAGEFCNNRTYYDKVSLNYFAEDGVVADDRDEIMENAPRILGDLQEAFSNSRSSNVIYIRNEELEVDYEVSLVDGSYRKEVLNMNE